MEIDHEGMCQPDQGCQVSYMVTFGTICMSQHKNREGGGGGCNAYPLDLPLVCTPFLNDCTWNWEVKLVTIMLYICENVHKWI